MGGLCWLVVQMPSSSNCFWTAIQLNAFFLRKSNIVQQKERQRERDRERETERERERERQRETERERQRERVRSDFKGYLRDTLYLIVFCCCKGSVSLRQLAS